MDDLFQQPGPSNLALLFSLRHEFPTEWAAFVNNTTGAPFMVTIRKDDFPYLMQGRQITLKGLTLYDGENIDKHHLVGDQAAWDAATTDLNDVNKQAFILSANEDTGAIPVLTRSADAEVFLIVGYAVAT